MVHRPWIIEARRLPATDRRRYRRWQRWAPYFAFARRELAEARFASLDDALLAALEFRKAYPPEPRR